VYVFFYVLAAMGIAFWAKLDGRNPAVWFGASIVLTPIGAGVALNVIGRHLRR
jgi:hypothetical protein